MLALAAAAAHAGNAAEPRVPPSFLGGECMEVLGPSDPPLTLTIGIPVEEVEATADEPPGTRSFQFFAACREPVPGEEFPPWIAVDDVEAAQAANPEILTPGDALILPTSGWAGCLHAITGREPRMPITCTATAEGVSLTAEALVPGNYVLYGYTYEPDKNVWTPRSGVVRVVGEDGEDALPPAVAFSYPVFDAVASVGLGITLTGCATGVAGTTVAFAWATASDLIAFGDAAWQTFDEIPASPELGSFAVPFVPPPDAAYKVVKFRALAVAPNGLRWAAYTPQPTVFEPGCAEPDQGQEIVADRCGVGDGTPEPTDAGAGQPGTDVCAAESADDGDREDGSDGDGTDRGELGGTESTGTGTDGHPGQDGDDPGGARRGCGCVASDRQRGADGSWGWLVLLAAGSGLKTGLRRHRTESGRRARPPRSARR